MTDIHTINPHIVITEFDEREQEMEDLKGSLREEGAIRDSREEEMAELKTTLPNLSDTREHQMNELRKHLGEDKSRVCDFDAHVIGTKYANIKNIRVSQYDPKPSNYSFHDPIGNLDDDCKILYDAPADNVISNGVICKEGTYGRRMYTITEEGVSIYCTLYRVNDIYMLSINNTVMPLREFLAVRHMRIKERRASYACGIADTIVCDTDAHDHTLMLPRNAVITFEIKEASVAALVLAQIVLETVLYENGEKTLRGRNIKNENNYENYINVTAARMNI